MLVSAHSVGDFRTPTPTNTLQQMEQHVREEDNIYRSTAPGEDLSAIDMRGAYETVRMAAYIRLDESLGHVVYTSCDFDQM